MPNLRHGSPPGLYVTFAGAVILALILMAAIVWPRASTLPPRFVTSFETDSPP